MRRWRNTGLRTSRFDLFYRELTRQRARIPQDCGPFHSCMLLLLFAGFACGFELIPRLPFDRLCLFTRQPAEDKSESGHFCIAAEVPVCLIFIGGLMVVVRNEVLELRAAPCFIMAFEQTSRID